MVSFLLLDMKRVTCAACEPFEWVRSDSICFTALIVESIFYSICCYFDWLLSLDLHSERRKCTKHCTKVKCMQMPLWLRWLSAMVLGVTACYIWLTCVVYWSLSLSLSLLVAMIHINDTIVCCWGFWLPLFLFCYYSDVYWYWMCIYIYICVCVCVYVY